MTWVALLCVVGFAGLGASRGAVRAGGLLLATVVAVLLAGTLGRGLEGVTALVLGTTGLMNRFVAMGVAGVIVVFCGSLAAELIARRVGRDEMRRRRDRWIGAGVGAAEGVVVAMVLMWAPLAIEPVARASLAGNDADANPTARRVVAAAEAVRGSAVGGLASSTNPVAESPLIGLAADFAELSRHPEAVRRFMETPTMRRVQALPSVERALDIVEADPELRGLYSERGVTLEGIRRALGSRAVLKILDETTIVSDLTPLAGDLERDVRRVREEVRSGGGGGGR